MLSAASLDLRNNGEVRHTGGEVFGVHRHPALNLAIAAGIAGATALLSRVAIEEDPRSPLGWDWSHSPFVVLAGAWLSWRALRRAVYVTSYGMEVRDLVTVTSRPWNEIVDVEVTPTTVRCSVRARCAPPRTSFWFTVAPSRADRLIGDVAAARLGRRADGAPVVVRRGAVSSRPFVLLVPAGLLIVGTALLRGADADEKDNAIRNARVLVAQATPLSWEVHEIDDGEGDSHRETWSLVRFTPRSGSEIEVLMKRRGESPDPGGHLMVVYDPMDPREVDFTDLPKRAERRESVTERRGWGAFALVVLLLSLPALAIVELRSRWQPGLGRDGG